MNKNYCISFDLDDTLWDGTKVIYEAEQTGYMWFRDHWPKVTNQYSFKELMEHKYRHYTNMPNRSPSMTTSRKSWLSDIATTFDYSLSEVDTAFQATYKARNNVVLYHGVLSMLEQLKQKFTLIAISNGNASVELTGLDKYFSLLVNPDNCGLAKPDPEIFKHALKKVGIPPFRTIHIGDSPINDILGANRAGLSTVWFNPDQSPWSLSIQPTAVATNIQQISEKIFDIIKGLRFA